MNVVGKALEELYRIFSIVNKDKFDNILPEPVITIQKTRGTSLGHFTLDKVWRDKNNVNGNMVVIDNKDEQAYYEINVDPRWFCSRTEEQIVETMIHEMCHYYNKINDVKDCSGNVHNKKFKSLAESKGLVVEKGKSVGWGLTSLSPELSEYIQEKVKPDASAFEYFRIGTIKDKSKNKKKNKSTYKYICPECGLIARAKKDVDIKCGYCDVYMEIERENEDEM